MTSASAINLASCHPVWVAWHYTALSLTNEDALLTSFTVEYSLPVAISTTWELGKPRSKQHRDVYEDGDVLRVAGRLEILGQLFDKSSKDGVVEDPFTTMLGFKACMMAWSRPADGFGVTKSEAE
ncbi:putative zinc finger c2h2-type protein [Seiridium cardinale]|uniref:Zinc finger c2h2-type protein n=1 Tax=Seiridium cardinale TaxID=138064 RepID=A0ABR2Y8Y0_9PEZI